MSQPARRRAKTVSRKRRITPEQIRFYIEDMLHARHVEWAVELFDSGKEIDWAYLLGLHLQLCELEHLQERMEDIPL